ncbi:MAG: protein GumC [Desulfobacterales bacterium]|nr:protein GumC [Desulfobacterales bacterium]
MQPLEIENYKDIAIRRMWWIIIPFLLSILMGIGWSLRLPRVYRASTLILVQPQKVPETYVREIVSLGIEDRVRTMTQQVTSRTNLEKIIRDFNLYNEPGSQMFMEDKVVNLRKRIMVDASSSGRRGTSTFQISFTGRYPKQVADVTNGLASYFITENLKLREDQAIGTAEFLAEELETIRRRLVQKEEELKRYRERYMGGLPEQLETNLRILERIQQQVVTNQENLREAENRKLLIQQQLAEAAEIRRRPVVSAETRGETEQPTSLDQLKTQLALLEARYTERHPDVIRLKEKISNWESREKSDPKESQEVAEYGGMSQSERNLANQLREVELGIKNLKAESAQLHSQMKRYQTQVENTPKREQELMSLNRDYKNIRETYNSLLSRKLEAQLAVSMERKQKGEQFRILDPARTPIRPFEPDIKRILFMSVALGLGLGCGLAYLKEIMDTSYNTPEEVEKELQLPVLVSMPIRYTQRELKSIKWKKVLAFASVGIGFILSAVGIVLAIKGPDATLNFIKNILAKM